jgi:hypothetical protein
VAEHHRNLNSVIRRVALVLTCALAFNLLAPPRPASAQDAFSCIEELTDDEVRYRIRYIEGKMQDGKKQATRWRYVWMSLWLGAGGGMTYAAINAARDHNNPDRFGWAYLAGGAYFFGLMHAALPAPDVWGAKRIRRLDDGTEEARRAKLLYATETLKQAADVEELMGGPLGVVGSLIYGVVGGTIKATQWTGASRGLTAALYVAPPLLLGLQTATAPRSSVAAYEAYRGIACSSKYYERTEEGVDFDFSVSPAGGSFTVSF